MRDSTYTKRESCGQPFDTCNKFSANNFIMNILGEMFKQSIYFRVDHHQSSSHDGIALSC